MNEDERAEQVSAFRRMLSLPIGDKPAVPEDKVVRLAATLMVEEMFETIRAMFTQLDHAELIRAERIVMYVVKSSAIDVDMVELFDGCGDVDYVVEGTRQAFGVKGLPIAREIHRANMTKGQAVARADGKHEKPPGFIPADVAGELRKQGWEEKPTERCPCTHYTGEKWCAKHQREVS